MAAMPGAGFGLLPGVHQVLQGLYLSALCVLWGFPEGPVASREAFFCWVVEVISASADQGSVNAHSTRGVSSSFALFDGVSVEDSCRTARWGSSDTCSRFYLRDVGSGSFSHAVLDSAKSGPW